MSATWLLMTAACLTGADIIPTTASDSTPPATTVVERTNAVPPGIPAGCGGPSFGYCEPCHYCKPTLCDRLKAFLKPTATCCADGGDPCTAVISRPTWRDRIDAFHQALGTSPYTASPGGLCSPCSGTCGSPGASQGSK